MNLCYTISGIQKRILRSITGCGEKATSYLVRWLTEDRRPGLDQEMIEILREFNRKYLLVGWLDMPLTRIDYSKKEVRLHRIHHSGKDLILQLLAKWGSFDLLRRRP